MATCLGDCFNIPIDEASGSGLQKVEEKASAIMKTPEQDNGETLPESATLGSGWPIFRVPAHVREVDDRAYSPRIVSIGPYHHDEEALRPFEDHKKRFLRRLKKRMGRECQERRLENAMKEMEEKTRECYSEEFGGIESDDFVQMMLLDGCFIVELLRLYTPPKKTSQGGRQVVKEKEPIIETRWMLPNIGRDLLMLENQLPMFVLQKIYDITTKGATPLALNELALRFLEPLRPGKDKFSVDRSKTNQEHPHLLALFQSRFKDPKSLLPKRDNQSIHEKIPGGKDLEDNMLNTNQQHPHDLLDQPTPMNPESLLPERDNQSENGNIPGKASVHNATTLTYAGVRFKTKPGSILDIEYKFTVLWIPTLYIDDGTSTLFRNLIAYEQSNRSAKPNFSSLAVFLDGLVDTVDDIKVLRRAGIIKQAKGGDQEVVDLFNSLTKELEIDMDDCYMSKEIQQLDSHRKAHETVVRFYRALSKLNFLRFITAYISTLLTLIYIWSAFDVCNCKDGHHKGGTAPGKKTP